MRIHMANRVVVVTGAGGFIGGHLVSRLLRTGSAHVRAVDIKPLLQWHQIFDAAENLQLDCSRLENCVAATKDAWHVYNLAADMGGMGFISNNRALCMLSVLINTHMLKASLENGVARYFYSSSACVYAADKQQDTDITALREEDAYPAMPEDGYGWEKLFSERMCRHFREDFGLVSRVARFHNVYGPHGTWDGGREKAPAAICRKAVQAKLSGDHTIQIWGDGQQTRSFMYIDDCLHGIDLLLNSNVEEPLNLGSHELVSINQLVDIVEKIAGVRLLRTHNLSAPQGVRGRNSDNTLIRRHFCWEPDTPLVVGLEKTYAWIYDQIAAGRQSKD
jgi:GDP-D-mannose 3', 5'-epimerase